MAGWLAGVLWWASLPAQRCVCVLSTWDSLGRGPQCIPGDGDGPITWVGIGGAHRPTPVAVKAVDSLLIYYGLGSRRVDTASISMLVTREQWEWNTMLINVTLMCHRSGMSCVLTNQCRKILYRGGMFLSVVQKLVVQVTYQREIVFCLSWFHYYGLRLLFFSVRFLP